MNPVGFSLQIRWVGLRSPLSGQIGLIHKVETEHFRIVEERRHLVDEVLSHALVLIEPDQTLHAVGQCIHLVDILDIREIEASFSWCEVTLRVQTPARSVV